MSRPLPTLRARLLRQFLLLGMVPVLAVFGAAWMLLVPVLVDQAEHRNRELALAVRDQVQLQLAARERGARMLAQLLSGGLATPAALRPLMQSMLEADSFLQALYVADAGGRVVEAALPPASGRYVRDALGLDLSGQPALALARQSRTPAWSDTFLSTLSGQITLVLAAPAGSHTVVLELSLATLSRTLLDLAQTGHSTPVVVDRAGRIVAHPDARLALQQENLRAVTMVEQALAGKATSGRARFEGIDQHAHALPVAPIGWVVFVAHPVESVLAPVRRLGGAIVAVLGGTIVLATLWGWWLARRTGNEVAQLADGAHVLAQDGVAALPQPQFSTFEFNAVWQRLAELFGQLNQRDRQTRAARQDLQAVLDAATEVAVIATDTTGTVTVFNVGAERMLGRSAADVVGRQSPLLWHDAAEVAARAQDAARRYGESVGPMEALVIEARHGIAEVRDWTFVRSDHSRLDVSLAVTAMRTPEGELKGFLGVAVDVTERRRLAAAELARRSAELASQAKSDFLSRMSHELRTPLNAVLGYAQLIDTDREHPPSARQHDSLQHIQRAGWHLVRLIDDVLDLARIESGRLRLAITSVDAAAAVEQARRLVAPQMLRHGVAFSVQMPTDPPMPRIAADETRLTQVLVNLLGNAAKYNRPHGSVTLECEPVGDNVVLRVRDTGLGMTAEQVARMFEPFNRLGREATGLEGTGIGLVITRHLVEAMHGRLEVRSKAGVGSDFIVTLPAATAVGAIAVPPPSTMPGSVPPRGRVLYIEDHEVNALLMGAILSQRPGLELQVCATMRGGIEAARAAPPDLLLLDLHLPDGTGEQVLDAFEADPRLAQVPVIVVSADATQARIQALRARGATDYLTKPLDVRQTLAAVDRALARAVPAASAEKTPGRAV